MAAPEKGAPGGPGSGEAGALAISSDGTGASRLRLRVSAGASRTRVMGEHGGAMKVSVGAPPEKGRANREVLALVARTFGLPVSAVSIVSGEASHDKVIRLMLSEEEAAARWRAFVGGGSGPPR